jgi:hypothetical protein
MEVDKEQEPEQPQVEEEQEQEEEPKKETESNSKKQPQPRPVNSKTEEEEKPKKETESNSKKQPQPRPVNSKSEEEEKPNKNQKRPRQASSSEDEQEDAEEEEEEEDHVKEDEDGDADNEEEDQDNDKKPTQVPDLDSYEVDGFVIDDTIPHKEWAKKVRKAQKNKTKTKMDKNKMMMMKKKKKKKQQPNDSKKKRKISVDSSDEETESHDDDDDDDVPEPVPSKKTPGAYSWHPNPSVELESDAKSMNNKTSPTNNGHGNGHGNSNGKKKASPKRSKMVDIEAREDRRSMDAIEEEEDEDDYEKRTSSSSKNNKNKHKTVPYTGDGPCWLTPKKQKLLVVKFGDQLEMEYDKATTPSAEEKRKLKAAITPGHVCWAVQEYRDGEPKFIPFINTQSGYVQLTQDITRPGLWSRELMRNILEQNNISPSDEVAHEDAQKFIGKIPMCPENIYNKFLEANKVSLASTPPNKSQTTPAPAKKNNSNASTKKTPSSFSSSSSSSSSRRALSAEDKKNFTELVDQVEQKLDEMFAAVLKHDQLLDSDVFERFFLVPLKKFCENPGAAPEQASWRNTLFALYATVMKKPAQVLRARMGISGPEKSNAAATTDSNFEDSFDKMKAALDKLNH